jgi:hypothetical protein
MRICIRTRVMHLMSDRAYPDAYRRLYIYGPLALEIERINRVNKQVSEASKVTRMPLGDAPKSLYQHKRFRSSAPKKVFSFSVLSSSV